MLTEMREFNQRRGASADDCRPVTASDFFTLLTSRRRMQRSDELGMGFRGLLDRETGIRYVVNDGEYFRGLNPPSPS